MRRAIDRGVFSEVTKLSYERRVDLTEAEMLIRLRKTLMKDG